MKQESLRLLIRSILQERVEYAEIPGTVQDAGWYAADIAADKRFKEYETLIDLLGVPVTIVFIPGRELPMSSNVQSFVAGEDVTRDTATDLSIQSVPTVVSFFDGIELETVTGPTVDKVKALIEKLREKNS